MHHLKWFCWKALLYPNAPNKFAIVRVTRAPVGSVCSIATLEIVFLAYFFTYLFNYHFPIDPCLTKDNPFVNCKSTNALHSSSMVLLTKFGDHISFLVKLTSGWSRMILDAWPLTPALHHGLFRDSSDQINVVTRHF